MREREVRTETEREQGEFDYGADPLRPQFCGHYSGKSCQFLSRKLYPRQGYGDDK